MNELIAYAYDLISYLALQSILKDYNVNKIIIYGSVARGDYSKDSDIDLFIDVAENKKRTDQLKNKVMKTKTDFFNSDRQLKWSNIGIKNDFSVIIGNIEDKKWIDLRLSMHSHAIILFDKYLQKAEKLNPYFLIRWEVKAKEANKRVNISRNLYGYNLSGKEYPGLISKTSSVQFGRGTIITAPENVNSFRSLFNKIGIKYRIKAIYS